MPDVEFLPECYADTTLIRLLIPQPKQVVHIYGISNVAKEMEDSASKNDGRTLIGIVDNDKRVPPYLQVCTTIRTENKIILKQHPVTGQFLLVIDKAIESFLIWNAQTIELDLVSYDFSDDPKMLGKLLKATAVDQNPNYLRLLTDLYARKAPGIITLKNLLNEFIFNK